jgi:hypothetical protein
MAKASLLGHKAKNHHQVERARSSDTNKLVCVIVGSVRGKKLCEMLLPPTKRLSNFRLIVVMIVDPADARSMADVVQDKFGDMWFDANLAHPSADSAARIMDSSTVQ